jgi:hypothetical protein
MAYDALGNYYDGEDQPFQGPVEGRPDGNIDWKRTGRIMADSLLDVPAAGVEGIRTIDNAWNALKTYAADRIYHAVRPNTLSDLVTERPPAKGYGQTFMDAQEVTSQNPIDKGLRKYEEATDKLTGAPAYEDRSTGEKVLSAIVPALIPGGEIAALNDVGRVGRGVNKVLAKTRNPFTDLVDPRTTHYTPTGVAVNATIGGGATAVLENLVNGETPQHVAVDQPEKALTVYPNDVDSNGQAVASTQVDEQPANKATDQAVNIGYSLAALPLLASLGMAHRIPGLGHNGGPKINDLSTNAGPGHIPVVKPGPSDLTYALDEMAPLEHSIGTAHADPQVGKEKGDALTANIRSNVGVKVEKAINTGQLDGLERSIPPVLEMKAQVVQDEAKYGPQFVADLNKGMSYRNELADRAFTMDTLSRDVADLDQAIKAKTSHALQMTDAKKQAAAFEEISEMQQKKAKQSVKLQTYQADTPDTRIGLTDVSNDELHQFVQQFEADPRMKPYMDANEKINEGLLDYANVHGVLSDEDLAFYKDNKTATHVLSRNDPYLDAKGQPLTGFSRAYAVFKDAMMSKTDDLFTMDKESRTPAYKPLMSREPAELLSDRVNNPINFLDAKHAEIDRMVRYVNRQNFAKQYVDSVLAGPNWKDTVTKKTTVHGHELWTAAQVNHGVQNGYVSRTSDVIIARGDKFQIVTPKDPRIAVTLSQPPLARTPILSEITRMFTKNTTGVWRPMFALKRVKYDAGIFSATRRLDEPHGIEGMYEQARRAANGVGVAFPEAPQWLNLASRFSTPISGVLDQSAIYANSFMGAIESYYRQNQKQFALALSQDLMARSPVLNAIGKASPQFMQNLSDTIMQSYNESLYATAARLNIVHPADFRAVTTHNRDYEKFFGRASVKFANNPIGKAFTDMALAYHQVMTSFEQGVQYSAFTSLANRLMMREGVQHFDQLSKPAQEAIARYARVSGGDFARAPGANKLGTWIQKANSVSPYLNVAMRSIQSLWRAGARNPGKFGSILLTGFVMPRVLNEYILSNWDDKSHQYWFQDTPHWERVQNMPMVSIAGLRAWHMGMPFKEEYVQKQLLFPEARVPGIVVSEGLRALGMYGKRSANSPINDPNLISMLDLAAAGLKDGFAPITPPAMQAMAKSGQTSVDPGNIFNLLPQVADNMMNGAAAQQRPGVFSPDPTQQGNDRTGNQTYNPTSNITRNTASVIQALLGSAANTALSVYDTYDQSRDGGDGVAEAAWKALQAGAVTEKAYAKKQIADTTGNLFVDQQQKVYRMTPTAEYVLDAKKTYDLVAGKKASITSKMILDNGGVLDQLISELRYDGAKDADMKDLRQQWYDLNSQTKGLAANRLLSPDERDVLNKQLLSQMRDITHQQADIIQQNELNYKKEYGPAFKQKYGYELNFATLRAVLTKAGNKAKYQPSP